MKNTVHGVSAPAPRMTKTAALMVATIIAIPVFAVLSFVDWLWF